MSSLILPAVLSGLTMGAVYALVALGLTLIYGVLHIINFAHGSLLMLALYAAYFLFVHMGLDPYLAIPILLPVFFCLGYVLQRWLIAPMSGGSEQNVLLVTINRALPILGIPDFWQRAVVGALIIGSIVLDRVLAARRARRLVEARDTA